MVLDMGYYIPYFTATTNSSLATFYGLRGEENRQVLARTFLEPTSWYDFCNIVDPSNCTVPMEGVHEGVVAARYPQTDEEKSSYFMPGLYTGHFRDTERTNCTINPQCSGHLIAPHCSWTTFADNQIYWNNIKLSLHGPETPNNGYSYEQMMQIWRAANATRSHVFMWWVPDLKNEEFHGTDYAFQRVTLPTATQECLNYRAEKLVNQKCSDSIEERRGDPVGACDYAPVLPKKVMSRGLKTTSSANKHKSVWSPAYVLLRQIYLPEYSSQDLFRKWASFLSDETLDAPREAVCEWVFEHLDELMRYSPESYPRALESRSYYPIALVGYIFGSIALCIAIITVALIFVWKGHQVIKTGQCNVLSCMAVGYIIVSISAILHAVVETSNAVCTLQQWTLRLGYTLEIVPILIKMSSINKLGREARRFRRAVIDPNHFKKFLSITLSIVVMYLIVWTALDMPKRVDDHSLKEIDGVTTVCVYSGCASHSPVWKIMALVWETLLLLSSTVLAYQSREIIQQLNESHWLAFLVYSHTLFLLVRLVVNVLLFSNMIQSSMSTKAIALILALDTIVAVVVYFCPKFCLILRNSKGTRTMQVEINHYHGPLRRKRRSFISGVNIPSGGVPNLIRRDVEQTGSNEDIGLAAMQAVAALDLNLSSVERESSGMFIGDEQDNEEGVARNLQPVPEQSIHCHNSTNGDDNTECNSTYQNADVTE
jgi:7 transmembrane sweet-taste receptor of 3 GCPR.